MKKEVNILLAKSLDSLVLSIDHFNRPWDRGREEAVLILIDRAFELLLKAIILFKNGKIREKRAKETIGFDKCVRKCVSEEKLKCLTNEQAITIQIINSLRDAAQHYILEISEQQLYIYSQAGVTLYNQLISNIFSRRLSDFLPERVLPISTSPPRDFISVIETEFKQIKKLVVPNSRKRLEARAKIRALAIVEASLGGERSQPSIYELNKLANKIQNGEKWENLFPGISRLKLDTSGEGLSVSIRLSKKDGESVHLVPEGTPGATVVAVKRVNELSYYCFGLKQMADKFGLFPLKLLAVVNELGLQKDPEYFKSFKIGSQEIKRYSYKAYQKLKQTLTTIDIDEVWARNHPKRKKSKFNSA